MRSLSGAARRIFACANRREVEATQHRTLSVSHEAQRLAVAPRHVPRRSRARRFRGCWRARSAWLARTGTFEDRRYPAPFQGRNVRARNGLHVAGGPRRRRTTGASRARSTVFFFEAGAGLVLPPPRRFSISLLARATAAASRLCRALGPTRCEVITPVAGFCPRSSRRCDLPRSSARSRAVRRFLARAARALSESPLIAGARVSAMRSRSFFVQQSRVATLSGVHVWCVGR